MSTEQKWKEHLFFIHDQLACAREEDPPENAVVVFLAPVEVEIRTQVKYTLRRAFSFAVVLYYAALDHHGSRFKLDLISYFGCWIPPH